MIDLTLTVELEDGEKWQVNPKLGTFIKFEKHFSTTISSAFTEGNISLTHLAWLAWEGSRKVGRIVPPFDKFVDVLVDLDLESEDSPLVDTA
jgi:hypothetical protein